MQDKDSKQRLKAMARCSQPLTAGSFSPDGNIYAYASCYDWGKGHAEHNAAQARPLDIVHTAVWPLLPTRMPASRVNGTLSRVCCLRWDLTAVPAKHRCGAVSSPRALAGFLRT